MKSCGAYGTCLRDDPSAAVAIAASYAGIAGTLNSVPEPTRSLTIPPHVSWSGILPMG